jgi:purine-cytosine permease-like protein
MISIDNNTLLLLVIVILIFALVAIAGFWFFRRRAKVKMQGPLGTSLELDGSNEPSAPSAAVKVIDTTSRSGGLTAKDETGRGVEVSRVDVEGDITASSAPGKPDPKV